MLTTATELRVCADPHDLPFSNQAAQGFENRIAAVIAADLKLPLTYVWFPQVVGFVRNTLRAHQCDLVMGTVTGDETMDTTDPYYHTGYMMVTRATDNITARAVADPELVGKQFGIIAATPPTDLLLKHDLLGNTHSYALAVDTDPRIRQGP
jgi:ABC-type amino acid transport substrate-binding protein